MPVIKYYENRKLYDTVERKYITLDRIAEMIREGQTCQVIDNKTGSDITTHTLFQIIVEQEKKDADCLPQSILEVLIHCGHDSMRVVRTNLPSLTDKLKQIGEDINSKVHNLIINGDLAESTGKKLLDQIELYLQEISIQNLLSDQTILDTLGNLGIPSRQEFLALSAQVEALNQKIALLKEEQSL